MNKKKKIIFIHGRSQAGKNPLTLKNTWKQALITGLNKSNLQLPSTVEFEMPFYGNVLEQLTTASKEKSSMQYFIKKGADGGNNDAVFFYNFLLEIAEHHQIQEAEILDDYTGDAIERGPLNWEWVQAILSAIDRKTDWGTSVLENFVYDVFLYLTDFNVRDIVNELVQECFADPETSYTVVGHSLGSVVGYEVLQLLQKNNLVHQYVTLGSPLGIKAVRDRLSRLTMPDAIQNSQWFNAYDPRDIVALNPLVEPYFKTEPSIDNKGTVENNSSNHHGIVDYLSDKDVAATIYHSLIS